MEYLKAWIWKQQKLREKGEEIDEVLLKYVEKLYNDLKALVETKLVRRTKTGNFEIAELADLRVENRILKDAIKAEIERCGGTTPILKKALEDINEN